MERASRSESGNVASSVWAHLLCRFLAIDRPSHSEERSDEESGVGAYLD